VRGIGAGAVVPYDLRHSFCSLLIQEGQSVVEVAAQAGHAPTMTLNTYAHVFEELKGGARLDAEAQIKAARAAQVPVSYPHRSHLREARAENAWKSGKPSPGLEPGDPFLTMTAQLRVAAGRLRVFAARSGLCASARGCLRVGSWRLRLPRGFHPGCARKPDRWGIVSLVRAERQWAMSRLSISFHPLRIPRRA
jgi:hypothetical protein